MTERDTVIVTGSSGRIGYAAARALADSTRLSASTARARRTRRRPRTASRWT